MNNYRQLAALHLNDAASFRLLGAYRMARLSIDAARKANARRKMLEFDFSALEARILDAWYTASDAYVDNYFKHGTITGRLTQGEPNFEEQRPRGIVIDSLSAMAAVEAHGMMNSPVEVSLLDHVPDDATIVKIEEPIHLQEFGRLFRPTVTFDAPPDDYICPHENRPTNHWSDRKRKRKGKRI